MGSRRDVFTSPVTLIRFLPEERIGRIPVGGSLEAVLLHPRDLRFKERDAFGKVILGIRTEIFACEKARCIAFGAWAIIVIHCQDNRNSMSLLSMALRGKPTSACGERPSWMLSRKGERKNVHGDRGFGGCPR